MSNSSIISRKDLAFQILLIVLGVGLAMAGNEWLKNRSLSRQADRALASIVTELKDNEDLARQSAAYNHELYAKLLTVAQDPSREADRSIFQKGYMHPTFFRQTAWEVAKSTNLLAEMEYERVLALSKAYGEQERYNRQVDNVGEILYRTIFQEGGSGVYRNPSQLAEVLSTFWFRECQLLDGFDQLFEEMKVPESERSQIERPPICTQIKSGRIGAE